MPHNTSLDSDLSGAFYQAARTGATAREGQGWHLAGDLPSTVAFLAEDLEDISADGTVQSRAEYSGVASLLSATLPDMRGVVSASWEEDDAALMTYHFAGTFENDQDMLVVGAGVIPACGSKVTWPEDAVKLTVVGDHIHRIEPQGSPIGSMQYFLVQLLG